MTQRFENKLIVMRL